MNMNTNLHGRLRNTSLPLGQGLLCVFEAVVNSIHSIEERSADPEHGEITIEVIRIPQTALVLEDSKSKRGSPPLEDITGFKVTDNGVGFNDANMASFETLDSEYKASKGCRGVGRLLWLKAFRKVIISSDFMDVAGSLKRRTFSLTVEHGLDKAELENAESGGQPKTCVLPSNSSSSPPLPLAWFYSALLA